MLERIVWLTAVALYGTAAIILLTGQQGGIVALFHWGFWGSLGLATVAATVGGALREDSVSANVSAQSCPTYCLTPGMPEVGGSARAC